MQGLMIHSVFTANFDSSVLALHVISFKKVVQTDETPP